MKLGSRKARGESRVISAEGTADAKGVRRDGGGRAAEVRGVVGVVTTERFRRSGRVAGSGHSCVLAE